jgi:hypothetical protein
MKYIDIDCYERGCACASSNRFAGEDCEVVEIVRYKDLTDEEILELTPLKKFPYESFFEYTTDDLVDFARAILRKAQEK